MPDVDVPSRWTPPRLAFAGAFVFRLLFLLSFKDNPLFVPVTGGSDRSLYDQLAVAVAGGAWWPEGVFQYMPLYAWVLGLLYKLFGASNFVVAGLVGALVDAGTCALIVRFGRRLGCAGWAVAVAAALYALYPLAVVYSVLTMPNTLNAFFVILFAERVTALTADPRPAWRAWLAVGLLAGVTCLSFAGMLLIGLTTAVTVAVLRLRRGLTCWPPLLSLLLVPACLIAPITIHNGRSEPGFVLITAHGGFNFWMGNHKGATGYPMQIEGFRGDRGSLLVDAIADAERREGRKLTSAEFSKHWSDRARAFQREHPAAALRLTGLKLLRFFSATEYDDLRLLPMIKLTGTWLGWPVWPGFALLAWLGMCGLFLVRSAAIPRVVLLTGLAGIVSFFITARYRLTLAPLLAVFAAGTLSALPALAPARRIAVGVGLLAAALLVWWPLPQTDFRALDHYNAATHLLERGLADEAIALADRGLALAPKEPDLHFVRGNACFGMNRLAEARTAYETALALRPKHAQARFNLAVVCKFMGDLPRARREAEAALVDDPLLDQARQFLKELP